MMLRVFSILSLCLSLSGCSTSKILNAFVPDEGYRVVKNVPYGTHARQKLDIYIPDAPRVKACTVLFVPGGSWNSSDKKLYKFAGQAFASQGCVTAVMEYRLYPQIRYPEFVKDTAQAVDWLRRSVNEYGGTARRIFMVGHSAGAYNVAMAVTHPDQLGMMKNSVKGVIGVAGPYDFVPSQEKDAKIRDTFSTVLDKNSMPVHWVTSGLPPMLLVTGENDREVQPRNTASFADKLRATGNKVHVITYPDAPHIGIVLSLLAGNRDEIPLLRDSMAFIDSID